MNNNRFKLSNYSILFLVIFISFNLYITENKITRHHKHPGSQISSHPDIEIEPLNKNDLNNIDNIDNDINVGSNDKEEKININQERIFNLDKNQEEIKKLKYAANNYIEDDEFVYNNNNNNIAYNKDIKDDSILDLDQEIKDREKGNINNIPNHPNQNMNKILREIKSNRGNNNYYKYQAQKYPIPKFKSSINSLNIVNGSCLNIPIKPTYFYDN